MIQRSPSEVWYSFRAYRQKLDNLSAMLMLLAEIFIHFSHVLSLSLFSGFSSVAVIIPIWYSVIFYKVVQLFITDA